MTMLSYNSKQGAWSAQMGEDANAPKLVVKGLQQGQVLKLTVLFYAREGSFYYSLQASANNLIPLTPTQGIFEDPEGWEACTLITLYEVQGLGESDCTFSLSFSKGDLSGAGVVSNLTLIAESV